MDQSKVKEHGAATARCGFIESSYRKANCIFYNQLNYNILEHPASIGHLWDLVKGKCLPVHNITPPPLPEQLRDIGSLNASSGERNDDERS